MRIILRQAIPRVFDLAADYKLGEHRIIGTSALSAIDSFNRNRTRLQPTTVTTSRPRSEEMTNFIAVGLTRTSRTGPIR